VRGVAGGAVRGLVLSSSWLLSSGARKRRAGNDLVEDIPIIGIFATTGCWGLRQVTSATVAYIVFMVQT